jgi:hypothetical protein
VRISIYDEGILSPLHISTVLLKAVMLTPHPSLARPLNSAFAAPSATSDPILLCVENRVLPKRSVQWHVYLCGLLPSCRVSVVA